MPRTSPCRILQALRTREKQRKTWHHPRDCGYDEVLIRVEWAAHTHLSWFRMLPESPPQPRELRTRPLCRSRGNGGFRKGSGFSQAPQLENGRARAHSHLSVTPGTLGLGDKQKVGCQVLLLEQLLIINLGWRRWVKWSEEERPWTG